MKIELSIITPEKELLKEQVDWVSLPTEAGVITVLPHHIALITALVPGELELHTGTTDRHLAIHGGFADIDGTRVRVLADAAELAEEIDERRAQEAVERAQKAKDAASGHEEQAAIIASLERNLVRLHVAKRRRRQTR